MHVNDVNAAKHKPEQQKCVKFKDKLNEVKEKTFGNIVKKLHNLKNKIKSENKNKIFSPTHLLLIFH